MTRGEVFLYQVFYKKPNKPNKRSVTFIQWLAKFVIYLSGQSFCSCRILYSKREVQRQNLPLAVNDVCFVWPGTGCTINIAYLCYRSALCSQSWSGPTMQSTVKIHSRRLKPFQSKCTRNTMEEFISLSAAGNWGKFPERGKKSLHRNAGSTSYRYYSQFHILEFPGMTSTRLKAREIGLNWHLFSCFSKWHLYH